MKKVLLFGIIFILLVFAGQAFNSLPEYSEEVITGSANGTHLLDCTVIRPWSAPAGPGAGEYPVIIWANGWNGGAQNRDTTTDGYKPGLIEWALDGPYIVVAANQWSVTESDVLACLQWIVDQDSIASSEYFGVVDTTKIGLSGHSQGGGVVIKVGDGEPNGFTITGVVAMSPYGHNWNEAGNQDGPVFFIGGTEDEVVPFSWFEDAWIAVQANDQGGILAMLIGGDHNSDAWGPPGEDPTLYNFGRYQTVTELWWRYLLKADQNAGSSLKSLLDFETWITGYRVYRQLFTT